MIVPESTSALSSSSGPEHHSEHETASLEALFGQVSTLAIRLKQPGKNPVSGLAQLPAAERAVLDIVHRAGAMTVPQIARERSTSRQNIQILVDRLQSAGRVELVNNPAHKRSALVRLTTVGTQWFTANEPLYRDFLSEIEAELARNEIQAGLSVLRKIHELLSKSGADKEEQRVVAVAEKARSPSRKVAKESAAGEETGVEEFPVNLL